MKLKILNELSGQSIEYSDVTLISSCIPRKGDKVYFGFTPPPIVEDVVWNFQNQEIIVITK